VPPAERSKAEVEEDPEEDEPIEDEPKRAPKSSRHRPGRGNPPRRAVKAWDAPPGSDGDPEDEPSEGEDDAPGKEHVYFRARDSVWFEPLVALMIIVVLLVSLFAYTSNWPPV
jgi:hypothetical protein